MGGEGVVAFFRVARKMRNTTTPRMASPNTKNRRTARIRIISQPPIITATIGCIVIEVPFVYGVKWLINTYGRNSYVPVQRFRDANKDVRPGSTPRRWLGGSSIYSSFQPSR